MNPLIIGLGGAGCRIAELFKKYKPLLIDTDIESLKSRKGRNKILIGKDILSGRGTLRNPEYAIKALRNDLNKIFERIRKEYDFCFIISSFGGTGASGYYLSKKIREEYDMKVYSLLITPSNEDDLSVKRNFNNEFKNFIKYTDAAFLINNDLFKNINLPSSFDKINSSISTMFNSLFEISEKDECIKINLYDIINSLKGITILGYNFKRFRFRIFKKERFDSKDFLELLREMKYTYNTNLNSAKRLMIISKYDKRYVKFSPSIVAKLFLENLYNIKNVRYGEILNKNRKIEQIFIFSEINDLNPKIKVLEDSNDKEKLYNVLKQVLNDLNKIQNVIKDLII